MPSPADKQKNTAGRPPLCAVCNGGDARALAVSTLSLHDALPIYRRSRGEEIPLDTQIGSVPAECTREVPVAEHRRAIDPVHKLQYPRRLTDKPLRSEEHTSELQSRPHLVCPLLLTNKKIPLGDHLCALSATVVTRARSPSPPFPYTTLFRSIVAPVVRKFPSTRRSGRCRRSARARSRSPSTAARSIPCTSCSTHGVSPISP